MRVLLLLGVLLALAPGSAVADSWPTKPDPQLTPGKARTDLTISQICNTTWGIDARHVTPAMKQSVIEAYHFNVSACPLTTLKGKRMHRVEIDHLISRELGGADDVANLWPECYEQTNKNKSKQLNGAHKKDRLENELGKRICHPRSEALLKEYQRKIATDWVALYREIYGDN